MRHEHVYETDYRGYTCCQICGRRRTIEVFPAHFNNSQNEVTVFMKLEKKEEEEEDKNGD